MMEDAILFVFGPVAVLVVVALAWARLQEQRGIKLRAAAEELGFTFKESDPELAAELFGDVKNVHLLNVMRGAAQGLETILFDLHRTIAAGNSVLHVRFSLLVFREEKATWPSFSLRPRQFSDRLTSVPGRGKLLFQNDIAFARTYALEAESEEEAGKVFTEEVRHFFARERGLWIEAKDQRMIITRGRLLSPRHVQQFLEDCFLVRKVLRDREIDLLR